MLKMFIFWKAVDSVEIKCLVKNHSNVDRNWASFTGQRCQYHSQSSALSPVWVLPSWLWSGAFGMLGRVKLQQHRSKANCSTLRSDSAAQAQSALRGCVWKCAKGPPGPELLRASLEQPRCFGAFGFAGSPLSHVPSRWNACTRPKCLLEWDLWHSSHQQKGNCWCSPASQRVLIT